MNRAEFLAMLVSGFATPVVMRTEVDAEAELKQTILDMDLGDLAVTDIAFDTGPIKMVDGQATVTISLTRIVMERE